MFECCGHVGKPNSVYAHTKCESLTPKLLPKRLIGVGSAEKEPFLVEPGQGSLGLYVALSYCWGKSQPVTLTREKLETGLPVFPIQQLPATLRDAIMICRELKFQYIWIDALCIIQDSLNGEDWNIESGKMNDIYGNAALTIAATATNDTSQGILDRFPVGLEPEACVIPYHLADGRVGKALLHFHFNETMKNEVLGTRAWALQEYLLSPRILSYQSNQLVWECKQGKQNANTPTDSHNSPREGEWNEIIAGFTNREMTNSSDRLAAISGYAKFTSLKASTNASLPAPRYLAGLWSTTLATDLLWRANDYPKKPRPAVYRAPSWSWAAIDSGVHFEPPAPHNPSIAPDILAAIVHPTLHNPFGSIPHAPANPSFLRLRARLRSAAGLLIEPLLRAHAQPGAGPPPGISVDFASGTRPDGHSSFSLSFDTLGDAAAAAPFYLAVNAVDCRGGLYRVFAPQSPLALLQMTQRQALVVVPVGWTGGVGERSVVVRRVGFLGAIYKTVGTFGPWFDMVGQKSLVTVI
jgi:Heterokaryon incompatibility protein (HET)